MQRNSCSGNCLSLLKDPVQHRQVSVPALDRVRWDWSRLRGILKRLQAARDFAKCLIRALLLHPASAVEASSLAAASSSSAENDGRICIVRPDVNLENTMLPATMKGEGPSAGLVARGCAGPLPGPLARGRLGVCALQSPPLSAGGSAGKVAPVQAETGLGLRAAASLSWLWTSCEPAGCFPSAGRREKGIGATLKWLPFLTETKPLLGKIFDLPLSQL